MAALDAGEAQANAQALADSFAQQEDGNSGYPGAPGADPAGEENPAKRKFDGQADFEEANRKRGSFNGPADTNGVRCLSSLAG